MNLVDRTDPNRKLPEHFVRMMAQTGTIQTVHRTPFAVSLLEGVMERYGWWISGGLAVASGAIYFLM